MPQRPEIYAVTPPGNWRERILTVIPGCQDKRSNMVIRITALVLKELKTNNKPFKNRRLLNSKPLNFSHCETK